ncbi:DNA polymerase IV [Roseivirga pacifica]|uniref:DNA polymerase IV n=1 Tax=Roseivirga pacifica TaxID=1267423 RepID=UPI002095893D|nr:DNA polymerase IV [Roseivirga pacifica]MCO6358697.1 DNA polymerase IV [Roseivirga pacifica]MCO6365667.1 DNA polymerase IV [Roseivirga pacifica]MCO6371603.1 DNA polymerase IV [Roseivirga pacifica]MCO6376286.1 DNA polymerase IV [Roseivirga pacifica]MCO6378981.1 DNA polymerase IV [Roseivirga pacifica]
MENTILHLDLDTFFVSVERLYDSRLVGKPVLIGGVSDRGVVASCSYEARTYGVHSAMPMKRAKELCPDAIQIRGNAGNYTKHSEMVTEIIKEAVPLYEKTSIDEFYADLTGMDKFFSSYQMAKELRMKIRNETGLPISFGLSKNKTVSKVATGEAKPDNEIRVDYGCEKPFLAPLSVSKIPMVGPKTQQTLYSLGVKRIQTIQEMPVELMEKVLGKNGVSIWKKANGLDNSPVIPYSERKSISTERTFDRDTIDVHKLRGILLAMAENLAFQLRRGLKLTACVTVKVRYSDFNTYTLQSRIPYTSADHVLIPKTMELFDKLYNKRLLVRLIGVRFSHLVEGGLQINLFDDNEEIINLYHAMDKIRDKHGDRSVLRAFGMEAKTISRFNPFNGEPPPLLPNRRR